MSASLPPDEARPAQPERQQGRELNGWNTTSLEGLVDGTITTTEVKREIDHVPQPNEEHSILHPQAPAASTSTKPCNHPIIIISDEEESQTDSNTIKPRVSRPLSSILQRKKKLAKARRIKRVRSFSNAKEIHSSIRRELEARNAQDISFPARISDAAAWTISNATENFVRTYVEKCIELAKYHKEDTISRENCEVVELLCDLKNGIDPEETAAPPNAGTEEMNSTAPSS